MDGYVSSFKETWYIPFETKKNELLEEYNEILFLKRNI